MTKLARELNEMNQNFGTAGQTPGQTGVQPVVGQPAVGQPVAQPSAQSTFAPAGATHPTAAGQTPQPTFAPGTPATRPTAAGQTPQAATPAGTATAATANPATKAPTPTTAAPTHTGPGTGVPNPHYTYNTKPPLLGTGLQRDILSLLLKIGVIAGIVLALFTFIFGVFQYSDHTMYPAVNSGDLILFSRFDKTYHAQDLVVVRYQGNMQVRRVVALSGNTVDIYNGNLIVDGASQQEEHIFVPTDRYETEIDFPLVVPEGHIFVLGDHRTGAVDSRIYGTIPIDDSQGKVISLFRRRGF